MPVECAFNPFNRNSFHLVIANDLRLMENGRVKSAFNKIAGRLEKMTIFSVTGATRLEL